jgi:hypothetical protein
MFYGLLSGLNSCLALLYRQQESIWYSNAGSQGLGMTNDVAGLKYEWQK